MKAAGQASVQSPRGVVLAGAIAQVTILRPSPQRRLCSGRHAMPPRPRHY
ncbi:MAG: hypothetical protein OXI78_00340 [Anaerolineaceae bacterium]|nr:hypothetical protein [Anaerolineaceae bacterium]